MSNFGIDTWGWRIVPDGRIEHRPVSHKRLQSDMRLCSVMDDGVAALRGGQILYVDSEGLAQRLIDAAGLTNWGLTEEEG